MSGAADRLVDAVVVRDVVAARALMHPDVDFRAMTPNRVWEADGPFVFEQQAYVRERDGRVGWRRLMCSGPRPAGG